MYLSVIEQMGDIIQVSVFHETQQLLHKAALGRRAVAFSHSLVPFNAVLSEDKDGRGFTLMIQSESDVARAALKTIFRLRLGNINAQGAYVEIFSPEAAAFAVAAVTERLSKLVNWSMKHPEIHRERPSKEETKKLIDTLWGKGG